MPDPRESWKSAINTLKIMEKWFPVTYSNNWSGTHPGGKISIDGHYATAFLRMPFNYIPGTMEFHVVFIPEETADDMWVAINVDSGAEGEIYNKDIQEDAFHKAVTKDTIDSYQMLKGQINGDAGKIGAGDFASVMFAYYMNTNIIALGVRLKYAVLR